MTDKKTALAIAAGAAFASLVASSAANDQQSAFSGLTTEQSTTVTDRKIDVAMCAMMGGMDDDRDRGHQSGSDSGMQNMPDTQANPNQAAAPQTHHGQGTVNSVNMDAGEINLTHGPIESLGWPSMTMDFSVKDKAALATVKPGQRVDFEIVKQPDGQYVITRITPAS